MVGVQLSSIQTHNTLGGSGFQVIYLVIGPELRNCSEVIHLDYVDGKLFTIYCDKEDLTVVHDVCNGQWTYYYQTDVTLKIPLV